MGVSSSGQDRHTPAGNTTGGFRTDDSRHGARRVSVTPADRFRGQENGF